MGFILVKNLTEHCYSNLDGEIIKQKILDGLRQGDQITLSFHGIDSVSSSFVNSALIDLLELYDFDHIKKSILFKDTNRSINDVIKKRFMFEVNARKKLIEV